MNKSQIKHMVDRFLIWKLPDDFRPDNGIFYQRPSYHPNVDATPTGTNLLDALQADALVRYMVEGMPPPHSRQMSYSELETALMKGAVELEVEHCLGLVTTRSVAMAFKKYVEPLTLSTADRDAIREALKGGLSYAETFKNRSIAASDPAGRRLAEMRIAEITAALALIGEG